MTAIPPRVRRALKERASIDGEPCCEICGAAGANNAHHRRNQSQGLSNELSNLLLLCGSGTTGCHGVVTLNPKWAHVNGWTLWRGEEPHLTPAVVRGQWMFLHDDGMLEAA